MPNPRRKRAATLAEGLRKVQQRAGDVHGPRHYHLTSVQVKHFLLDSVSGVWQGRAMRSKAVMATVLLVACSERGERPAASGVAPGGVSPMAHPAVLPVAPTPRPADVTARDWPVFAGARLCAYQLWRTTALNEIATENAYAQSTGGGFVDKGKIYRAQTIIRDADDASRSEVSRLAAAGYSPPDCNSEPIRLMHKCLVLADAPVVGRMIATTVNRAVFYDENEGSADVRFDGDLEIGQPYTFTVNGLRRAWRDCRSKEAKGLMRAYDDERRTSRR
jgi:hypothetical protein